MTRARTTVTGADSESHTEDATVTVGLEDNLNVSARHVRHHGDAGLQSGLRVAGGLRCIYVLPHASALQRRLGLEALQNLKCFDPEPKKSGDHLVVSRAAIMVDAGGQ
jgi:hypothetical protein